MTPMLATVLADAQQLAQAQQPSIVPMIVMMALLFGIIYLLIVRPQQRAEAQRREMQARIKKNDHVITSGGIKGVVTSVKDDEVTLKVDEANNVRIRFTRSAIVAVAGEGDDKDKDKAEGGEKK